MVTRHLLPAIKGAPQPSVVHSSGTCSLFAHILDDWLRTPCVAALQRLLQDCPAAVFESYWSMRQHAVPIGRAASGYLEPTACRTALAALVAAPLAAQYKAAQLELHPELLALAAAALDGAGLPLDQHQHHQNQHNNLADSAARRHDDLADVPNATPVVAWVLPKQHLNAATSAVTTTTQQVVQASYEAFDWLRTHAVEFPLLAKTGSNVAGNSSSGSSGSGHEMPD